MPPRKKGGKYPHYTRSGDGSGRKKPAGKFSWGGLWRRRIKPLLIRLFITSAVLGTFALGYLFYSLPNIDNLNKFTKTPSIIIKSEDGQIVGSFGDIYGDYVPYEEIPQSLIDAVVATEDRSFNRHFGIDIFGLMRATWANIRARHVVQGGSTITQQLAKNVFLTPERSLGRKLREMLLAIKLERRFSKEDIMSIYLNRVYLGAGNYGIDAAAKRYFGKSARELTLTESAIMTGLLKAPSRYAPTSNPALSRKRADQVLLNMLDAGYLTKEKTEKARSELASAMEKRKRAPQSNMYFADWIADQLPEYVGNVQEDLVVITTFNPAWQAMADKAIVEVMDKSAEKFNVSQAALLSMEPDGAVRAMVGGRSYADSQFNRVTQSQRQPGSAFKMFVYLAGLESGMTPDTLVVDEPITIETQQGPWRPKNYTGKYLGEITLREALAQSINTVAVQVSEQAGLEHVVDVARRLGIGGNLQALHSIALGSVEVSLLELTTAYAHLPAGGEIVYPYGILQIDTSRGEPVYRREASSSGRVLRSDTVGMINDMLMEVVASGTARAATIGRPVAGKTGTTSDYKDAWFIGYTPDVVTGVWVGNDDNTPMKKVTGGGLPAQIWRGFMAQAVAGMPVRGINTSSSVLPWSESPLGHRPQANDKDTKKKDVTLGKSFWDKLLGANDEKPKVEYKYPNQRD